ncbi:heme lyase CcmF/NrfE family subunit [Paraglaciecola aquimarina]|uniref:Heme lyase CcmF/NrfE family subunit n=1 Tax=Paraglaciecola algarum TaxID=3050085 RepID=A0ABS9D697_9ALTE|nr:heme lyase CcmF/NrfE family subunit [Paraglaciecola sp. G1-23]MCF2948463.1 heme lyase CcmF/NrfE family subunit [Paraglaciecola sp. G1-23]
MLAELGNFSLVMALVTAVLLSIYPMWGAYKNHPQMMAMAKPLAIGMFLFTGFSYFCLTYAFVHDDFSLAYVANTSSASLPIQYKYTGVWGGHEGSFLLWVMIFSTWTVAVALFSKAIPVKMVARVLAILGAIGIGFYLFMLLTSNPFDRLLPFYPIDGKDLNPLLQDFGMIIHPPMLYMGYVGFSVAFSFAIAALISGQLDSTWARWSRPWTIAAWSFLTLGLALGSWWAYYELGWGGWWFWDPSENAAFMPWLAGTALMHSLAVTEKRKVFKSWTVFLAISAFSLSLLGTFLIRSGVLVSVHAFASDPSRGLFILGLLAVIIGGSLFLYALRASQVKSNGQYTLVSREVLLMGNNVFLTAATLVVLLGTLFPLVHKELGMGSISIGAPFFNQMFTYLIVPFVLFMGIGPLSRWKNQSPQALYKQLTIAFGLSLSAAVLINLSYDQVSYMAVLGLVMSFWIMVTTIMEIQQRIRSQDNNQSANFSELKKLTRSHWGMVLGHLGFAVALIGMALVSAYSDERNVRMAPGDKIVVQGYEFEFKGVTAHQGPNYTADLANVDVFQGNDKIASLVAEKRFYPIQRNVMTEAGIDSGFTRDLFVALGEQLKNGDWSIRIYVKPFITWIWGGAFIMALGGVLSISDRRYRMARLAKNNKANKTANSSTAQPLSEQVS